MDVCQGINQVKVTERLSKPHTYQVKQQGQQSQTDLKEKLERQTAHFTHRLRYMTDNLGPGKVTARSHDSTVSEGHEGHEGQTPSYISAVIYN